MRRFAILCAAALALSLLSGCMHAVVITSPKDEEFQRAWDDSMEELRKDLLEDMQEAPEDGEVPEKEDEDVWKAWSKSWEAWGEEKKELFSNMDQKKHYWKVLDADGQELSTVTDAEMVKTLDDLLSDNGNERLEEDPGDPMYSYVFCQEKTLLAGQDPKEERGYEELVSFTVSASENVVTMRITGGLEDTFLLPGMNLGDILTFSISAPSETVEALRNPEQFS